MSKPDEMDAEAEAILRIIDIALGQRSIKSVVEFSAPKARAGVIRLQDAAAKLRQQQKGSAA